MRFACFSTAVLVAAAFTHDVSGQFIDNFERPAVEGWTYVTGDGEAEMNFKPGPGYASIVVDASNDEYNIWWAVIKHEVSGSLNLERLSQPGFELRVEARVRPSHAPRRVNLHLNTQRTVDFHSHLMEYDLPDTGWHVISMTTKGFDAGPGDVVNVQLALIDWGRALYRLEIDYMKVDVVDVEATVPDTGEPLPYHPPVPPVSDFAQHVGVTEAAMVDLNHPDLNLAGWRAVSASDSVPVLTVDGSLFVILRWDLAAFSSLHAAGPGVLEMKSHMVQRSPSNVEELGQVRVVEILDGAPDWQADAVTLKSWTRGRPLSEVVNTQMIIDVELAESGSTFATINRRVMQRMIEGRTLGLMLRPLGPLSASIYPPGDNGPILHFNVHAEQHRNHKPE